MGSGKKRSKSKEEGPDQENSLDNKEEDDKAKGEDDKDDEAPSAAASASGKKNKNKRNPRKEQRDTLRSKNLGLIRIPDGSDETNQRPKKILFGDDDYEEEKGDEEGSGSNDNHEAVQKAEKDDNKEAHDDEDDDAVEQMDSKAARDMAMAELQRERETKAHATKKKRKRKTRDVKVKEEKDSDEDEDMLEEDFFAELDAQKSALKKVKKSKKETMIPKHTVFRSSSQEESSRTPIEVNPGMELVVLGGEEEVVDNGDMKTNLSLALTEEPSQSTLHNSRVVEDGSDIISAKQRQKQKRSGRKPPEANWKRSKKMNRLLLNKGRGKGKPAANFVVRSTVKTYKF